MLLRRVTRLIPSIYLSPWLLSNCEPYSNKPSNHFNKIPLTGKEFRALDVESRNQLIRNQLGVSNQTLPSADDLATLTENVIGKFVLGQSIVFNAKINGQNRVIPLVTEEPSVVAAINNAIKLFNESGGLAAETDPVNLISGQVLILKNGIPFKEIEAKVNSMEAELKTVSVNELEKLQRLVKRGGGYYGNLKLVDLDDEMAALEFQLDVQEAMGANIVSLVAENLGEQLRGSQTNNLNRFKTLVHILSNDANHRRSHARVSIPIEALDQPSQSGKEIAVKIVQASRFAFLNSQRAVTSNKGVDNAVMALALAMGQDIRATSAALHYYAQNKGAGGKYGPVTRWEINETHLIGTITVPTPVSVVGRVKANPSVADNFLISKVSSAKDLGQLMACVGLAANFSAINALVGKGIIEGHMRLHNQANIKVK